MQLGFSIWFLKLGLNICKIHKWWEGRYCHHFVQNQKKWFLLVIKKKGTGSTTQINHTKEKTKRDYIIEYICEVTKAFIEHYIAPASKSVWFR